METDRTSKAFRSHKTLSAEGNKDYKRRKKCMKKTFLQLLKKEEVELQVKEKELSHGRFLFSLFNIHAEM